MKKVVVIISRGQEKVKAVPMAPALGLSHLEKQHLGAGRGLPIYNAPL